MEQDNRRPEQKYIFPNEEMLHEEERRTKPGDGVKPKPEGNQTEGESPRTDLSKPFETQGVELYDVPPPDMTVSSD